MFDENVFPFSKLHSNAGAQLRAKILLLAPSLRNFYRDVVVADHRAHDANPIVENVGVQAKEVTNEQGQQEDMSESIEVAMGPVAAIDPAESASNQASANEHESARDSEPVSRVPVTAPALNT
jgi:hypothetical protein